MSSPLDLLLNFCPINPHINNVNLNYIIIKLVYIDRGLTKLTGENREKPRLKNPLQNYGPQTTSSLDFVHKMSTN